MEKKMNQIPDAYARIKGGERHESIRGNVYFYSTYGGSIILVEVYGIPKELEDAAGGFFGFHLHSGETCTGNAQDPFADMGGHYNPNNEEHPRHVGDLPVLMSSNGVAWMKLYTARFYPEDIVGKTVAIHGMPDDFRSQPAGDSGMKVACGEIKIWEGEYR